VIKLHQQFYNLSADPFRLSSDFHFSFAHASYANAIAYLKFALFSEEGFIVITGRPGTGKTTLINELMSQLDSRKFEVSTLVTTRYEAHDLLHIIAASFDLEMNNASKSSILLALEKFLRRKHADGKRVLLIVDEAQGLTKDAVEELRQLSNLQVDGQPLLQIFLIGQEEFRELIESPGLEQLRQRVVAASHLEPLDETETVEYVTHRLKHAGWKGDPAITRAAILMVHHYSGGIPRIINMICGRLLFHGYIEKKHELNLEDIKSVLDELSKELLVIDSDMPFDELAETLKFSDKDYLSPGEEAEPSEKDSGHVESDTPIHAGTEAPINATNDGHFASNPVSVIHGNAVRKVDDHAWVMLGEQSQAVAEKKPAEEVAVPVELSKEANKVEQRDVFKHLIDDSEIRIQSEQEETLEGKGKSGFSLYTAAAVLTGLLAGVLLTISFFKGAGNPEILATENLPDTTNLPVENVREQVDLLKMPVKDETKSREQKPADIVSNTSELKVAPALNGQGAQVASSRNRTEGNANQYSTKRTISDNAVPIQENISRQRSNSERLVDVRGQEINPVARKAVSDEVVHIPASQDIQVSLLEKKQGVDNLGDTLQGVAGFGAEKQRQFIFEGSWISKNDLVDFLPAENVFCKDFVRFVSCWSVPEYSTSSEGSYKHTVESRLSGFTDGGVFLVTSNLRTLKLPDKSGSQPQITEPPVSDISTVKNKRCVFIDDNYITCSVENGHIERFSRITRN
jgi:type II secretory pathway predicted ATPase ExeA